MRATLFSSPGRPDKTFAIAVAAAAILGFGEFIAVALHYTARYRAEHPSVTAPATVAQTSSPAPVVAPSAVPAIVKPAASPSNAVLSVAEELLKEASLARERGDTTNALARLQDAAERDPKNARVLAEMAMIYESMGLFDRSNETWRKIQEIGPSTGPLFELADMKLKVGANPATSSVSSAGPGFAGVSPLDSGSIRSNPEGIPDGSTFGITEASITENPDTEAETNLTLRVGVKVRPNTIVDHTKVKIQVYFYDTVENNKVALTDAEVNYEWVTPDHDWKSTNPEILAVSYIRLKNGALSTEAALAAAAAQVTPPTSGRKSSTPKKPAATDSSHRKYAGYQIRVYYMDQLQDVRAEPTKLLNLYPPPLSLINP
ncbi:MAG: tetratricopeptide repeat protein [Chthoniobacterales bacterium]